MTREKLIRYVRHLKSVQDLKRKDMSALVEIQIAQFISKLPEDVTDEELHGHQEWIKGMLSREFPEGLR